MVSAILLVQHATPETITLFHDQLSNELPNVKGDWRFTFKIFRNNIYSIPPEAPSTTETAPETSFLYTLTPSYLPETCIALVNKKSVGIFCNAVDEDLDVDLEFSIPNSHLHKGATSGLSDSFDSLLQQRLQSLWVQRQVIKGDGGQIYALENGNLTIKTSNVWLHGQFRGLLIQMDTELKDENPNELFASIIEKYKIPTGNLCCQQLDKDPYPYGDLALQYAEILNF